MAPKTKKDGTKAGTRRGSPEAVEKRRAARHLNTLLTEGGKPKMDGRTERRRKRLIRALKGGPGVRPLKPIERVQKTHDLLGLGETMATLKKQGIVVQKVEATDEILEAVERTQRAYDFEPEAWRILGIRVDRQGRPIPWGAGSE